MKKNVKKLNIIFCNNIDLKKEKCKNQCNLCKRLQLEYSFTNKK